MRVMMPVEVMSEACMNCPKLDVDTHTTELYSIDVSIFENDLKCAHYPECKIIFNYLNNASSVKPPTEKTEVQQDTPSERKEQCDERD